MQQPALLRQQFKMATVHAATFSHQHSSPTARDEHTPAYTARVIWAHIKSLEIVCLWAAALINALDTVWNPEDRLPGIGVLLWEHSYTRHHEKAYSLLAAPDQLTGTKVSDLWCLCRITLSYLPSARKTPSQHTILYVWLCAYISNISSQFCKNYQPSFHHLQIHATMEVTGNSLQTLQFEALHC